ncbi:hypothetical protein H310_00488 [Aphanomyces invadans]|uniref:PDZ domain-containing protein n=1 Tax=Aphanomyces invadans TaxID=157072 RepID=A0A024UWQ4_9STRA|nr:hypothetical protein H310_00488 [Aphanomyces invadans]ETW10113.1 hypothetical protein H310_00488 [Aphanomyces invadans]|eukprot:XP_008861524.1 hypothetical protein H310_00488 [Aphanomyces invadans]
MLRCACVCSSGEDDDLVDVGRRPTSHAPPSPSNYATFRDDKKPAEVFRRAPTTSSQRPTHKETMDSPTIKEYRQHMVSTTLASEWQEMRSREVGHATASPVFLKKPDPTHKRSPSKSRSVSPATKPGNLRDVRQVETLCRTESPTEVVANDPDPHSIVHIQVPPGPTGLVLRPNSSAPVVVAGFEPVYTSQFPSGGPGPIESSDEDVGPGALLVAIDKTSLLEASMADVVALMAATEGNPRREFVFQTYTSEL